METRKMINVREHIQDILQTFPIYIFSSPKGDLFTISAFDGYANSYLFTCITTGLTYDWNDFEEKYGFYHAFKDGTVTEKEPEEMTEEEYENYDFDFYGLMVEGNFCVNYYAWD